MAQICHAIRMEEEINNSTSYWSLFTVPGNRKRMRIILGVAVFSQWSGNGLVSYYLNLVLEGVGITDTKSRTPWRSHLPEFNLTMMTTIAFNEFVNPWAPAAISWWYYGVYCGWLILGLLFVIFFIVEPKGRTLEEIAALFDGDEQPLDLIAMGGDTANMMMQMNRSVILSGSNSHHKMAIRQEEYYEM
ncbi:hypothetical protein BDZ97DRAFT_1756625 [Flammula alnicola]|nr:hypothetical protein BDZ97DRAFT_1756625 [Flammula alnicola]